MMPGPFKTCPYCGKPVLSTSWYSIAVGNCLHRAVGLDCRKFIK